MSETSESLQVIQKIFDVMDTGVLVVKRDDTDGVESFRFLYCNESGAKGVGLPIEQVVGRRAIDVFPNVRKIGLLATYADVLTTGTPKDLGEITYRDERLAESVFHVKVVPIASDMLAVLFFNVSEEKRAQARFEEQNQAILAVSTPTIELWKDILLLPLIGELDTQRTQQMTEHLLYAIVEHHAQVAIFDITGVPSVDTYVAQSLLQAVQAARMLGAEVIVTGISPDTAMTLVKLGLDISGVKTYRSLHRGIAAAFHKLNLDIVSRT